MSDTVDDLHSAEDFAGSAVECLKAFTRFATKQPWTGLTDHQDGKKALSSARALISNWAGYCRPTCGADGDPDFEDGDGD